MGESSVKAGMQFRNYKIERFKYDMQKNLGLLELNRPTNPGLWEFQIAVKTPIYYKKHNIYLCGIDSKVILLPKEGEEEEKALVKVEASIVGTFGFDNKGIEDETKELLVKVQMPALLMPYLRGTISTFLSNSGFSSVIFPLINVHELAKEGLKDIPIQVIE